MTGANEKPQKKTTMAFRDDLSTRLRLEAIQLDRGHGDLSETLREAVHEYITAHAVVREPALVGL